MYYHKTETKPELFWDATISVEVETKEGTELHLFPVPKEANFIKEEVALKYFINMILEDEGIKFYVWEAFVADLEGRELGWSSSEL